MLFALAAGFLLLSALIPFASSGGSPIASITNIGKDKIAIVEIFGPIISADDTVRQFKNYSKDSSIKGIILHVNSPGGGASASEQIYHAILRAKKSKPVVAYLDSVAASGGYYAALAADKIISSPSTITGSIGVIISFMDARELMGKIGVKTITVKSGKFKDIGSSGREFNEEDRKVIQSIIDDMYGQFVEAVMAGRNMDEALVRKLADGRIYSGKQAKALNLVDDLGTYYDAVEALKKMAGISGDVTEVRKKEKLGFLKELLEEKLGIGAVAIPPMLRPGAHYLWAN